LEGNGTGSPGPCSIQGVSDPLEAAARRKNLRISVDGSHSTGALIAGIACQPGRHFKTPPACGGIGDGHGDSLRLTRRVAGAVSERHLDTTLPCIGAATMAGGTVGIAWRAGETWIGSIRVSQRRKRTNNYGENDFIEF